MFVFLLQDQLIAKEKTQHHISGGCTALVALFIMGKLYISNAGDSRYVHYPITHADYIKMIATHQDLGLGEWATVSTYDIMYS